MKPSFTTPTRHSGSIRLSQATRSPIAHSLEKGIREEQKRKEKKRPRQEEVPTELEEARARKRTELQAAWVELEELKQHEARRRVGLSQERLAWEREQQWPEQFSEEVARREAELAQLRLAVETPEEKRARLQTAQQQEAEMAAEEAHSQQLFAARQQLERKLLAAGLWWAVTRYREGL